MNLAQVKSRIKGPVFSVMTPFLENEEIDFGSLEKYLEKIYEGGGRVFYVMGYNSRFSQLSWDEIKVLNGFVTSKVKAMNPSNLMIVADPLHCSTRVSCDFAEHAQRIGADVISIICREKFYSEEQVFSHFATIANCTSIGILVHEMPFLSGYGGPPVNYSLDLLDRLADIENVIALKEDAKDDELSKNIINKVKDRVSIVISGGGKRQWLRFAADGCQAWLNGIGVFEPRLASLFWEYYQSGNEEGYMEIINKVEVPFFERGVKRFGWHLTVKSAMEHRNLISRYERMPLMPLDEKAHAEIGILMNDIAIDEII